MTFASRRAAGLLLLALLLAAPAAATEDDPKHPAAHGAHSSRHVAVVVGAARAGGHQSLALGADAEYRLPIFHERFGLTAVGDAVFAEHTHGLVGAGLAFHPAGGLKLMALPAIGFESGHRAFVMRAGVGYDVHAGAVTLTPSLNVDISHGHVSQVAGVAVGFSF